MKKQRVLILGGGAFHVPSISSVRARGYEVAVVDAVRSAPGRSAADIFVVGDMRAPVEMLQLFQELGCSAVMPMNDFGVVSAGYINTVLGLRGHSYTAGLVAVNKLSTRQLWSSMGLPQPEHTMAQAIDEAVCFFHNHGRKPVVMKPAVSGGGGRGVRVCRSEDQIARYFSVALSQCISGIVVVEEFVEGTEYTVDVLIVNGKPIYICDSDKKKADGDSRVATFLNFPADIDQTLRNRIRAVVADALSCFAIDCGYAHVELIISRNGDIKLIELGLRGGGGHLFSTIPRELGSCDAPATYAAALCGELNVSDATCFSGDARRYICYHFPSLDIKGEFQSATLPDYIKSTEAILDAGIMINAGTQYQGLVDSLSRPAFILCAGRTREESIALAERTARDIQYTFLS